MARFKHVRWHRGFTALRDASGSWLVLQQDGSEALVPDREFRRSAIPVDGAARRVMARSQAA